MVVVQLHFNILQLSLFGGQSWGHFKKKRAPLPKPLPRNRQPVPPTEKWKDMEIRSTPTLATRPAPVTSGSPMRTNDPSTLFVHSSSSRSREAARAGATAAFLGGMQLSAKQVGSQREGRVRLQHELAERFLVVKLQQPAPHATLPSQMVEFTKMLRTGRPDIGELSRVAQVQRAKVSNCWG